jgi:hypothetical protein
MFLGRLIFDNHLIPVVFDVQFDKVAHGFWGTTIIYDPGEYLLEIQLSSYYPSFGEPNPSELPNATFQ